jgi:multidrug transporter EmrE-like cation transporter
LIIFIHETIIWIFVFSRWYFFWYSLQIVLLKVSEGFTKPIPIIYMYRTNDGRCLFCIAKAMHALPVGFAYSTYSGLTVAGVVAFAMIKI